MGADYHHTVIKTATPFRDFTKWCRGRETYVVDNYETKEERALIQREHQIRRENLRRYIRANYPKREDEKGNVSAFAEKAHKKQSLIADVLRGEKPFGDKLARVIEHRMSLPRLALDQEPTAERSILRVLEQPATYSSWPFSSLDRARFDRLPQKVRDKIEGVVGHMIGEHERADRAQTRRKSRKVG